MGMDVYGKAPANPNGEYFRNTISWWGSLWRYCMEVSEDAAAVKLGLSNDGDGLDAAGADRLGEKLLLEIHEGRTEAYASELRMKLDALPDKRCAQCEGTGIREWPDGPRTCNVCHGKGMVTPWEKSRRFSVQNVHEFAEFCIASGGFEIW